LTSAQERAVQLVTEHRDELDRLARALLERESLGQADLKEILGERAGKNGEKTSDLNLPFPSSVTP
jgi:ATP-dependent Zn protease